ncbi:PREDICTED: putative nuclease HARBI1 [Rhagoletis zephyria]|uniref:putative nuclease HARBI1 n=1 Tax=Rhagoletis zephyria TaxID=28612 RepID=UPI000811697B|nr:PREDICTED: putative nuclease HARBI1 [Rhagoletis zephyria]
MEHIIGLSIISNLDSMRVIRKPRTYGAKANFFEEYDEYTFVKRFRLSKKSALYIFEKIQRKIRNYTQRNHALSPLEMLLLALRFYASGSFLITVADFCGVSTSTASRVVKRVSYAIAELSREYIKMPKSSAELEIVNRSFHRIANFPKVVGCIDCTHVKIQSPGGVNAEIFRNREGYFSYNVQAVCNANLEITDLVCRWPGSAHDANIFNNSRIKHRFELNQFKDCFILGDSGYGVSRYMMTPLLHPNTAAERLYNESQIRTRNCVERCFGVWKRRFPVLSAGLRVSQNTVMAVIVACGVLHNIARQNRDADPSEEENFTAEESTENAMEADESTTETPGVSFMRSSLIRDYFARL